MACTPSDVAANSKCFCFSDDTADAVAIYLLCQWAGGGGVVCTGGWGAVNLGDFTFVGYFQTYQEAIAASPLVPDQDIVWGSGSESETFNAWTNYDNSSPFVDFYYVAGSGLWASSTWNLTNISVNADFVTVWNATISALAGDPLYAGLSCVPS